MGQLAQVQPRSLLCKGRLIPLDVYVWGWGWYLPQQTRVVQGNWRVRSHPHLDQLKCVHPVSHALCLI